MIDPKQKKFIVLGVVSILFLFLIWSIAPPRNFPKDSILSIPDGSGLYVVGQLLEQEGFIRSPFWFRSVAIMLSGERRMKAGQYFFDTPESSVKLAWRILHGDYKVETVKLTIPEGFTNEKISDLFGERFTLFDNTTFLVTAPEGYLFPDTYFIQLTATASSTIKLMQDNFDRKVLPLLPEIEKSKHTLHDIVVMASLIEGETNNQKDREMVSSILWKRLRLGMLLQVDVERKTYEFKGLPEKPINNPGLASIKAAIYPTTTPYLYYLTGNDGKMHYAKTFDEHKQNIVKYLTR